MTDLEKIKQILSGIDKVETITERGWWETTEGAEFGAEKLAEIEKVLTDEFPQYESERCEKCGTAKLDIKINGKFFWLCPNCK